MRASSPSSATRRWPCPASSRSSPGRTCRASSTRRRRTRTIWSTPTTPTCSTMSCASSARGSRPCVAETEGAAEEACRLLEVEYELLPAVFDPEVAMEPDAPILHEKERRLPRQHLCRHSWRARQCRAGLQGGRRHPRDDLLDLARAARASGDARLDRLAGRGRAAACAHELAGAVHRQAEALLSVRAVRPRRACLHRAHRRRLRRQAGDDLRGSLRARRAEDRAAGDVGVHAPGAVHRRHHAPSDDHACEARRQEGRYADRASRCASSPIPAPTAIMAARRWPPRSAARSPPIAAPTRRPTATPSTPTWCRPAAFAAMAPRRPLSPSNAPSTTWRKLLGIDPFEIRRINKVRETDRIEFDLEGSVRRRCSAATGSINVSISSRRR